MFPVLVVFLLLCLPCCWSAGACPSKLELKTCTCRLLKLKTDIIAPQRRRREINPMSTGTPFPDSIHLAVPTDDDFTHFPYTDSHPTTNAPLGDDFDSTLHLTTSTDNSIHSTHPTDIGDIPVSETGILGRRMGVSHSDDDYEITTDHAETSGLGVQSRSLVAILGKKPPERRPEPLGSFQLTVVDCNEPKTITEFEEILLSALHRRSVDKLIVSHLPPAKEETLARLPSKGMRNTRIKQFEIRDTALSGDFIWYGSPFAGQGNSLLRFAANRCYLYGALTYEDPGTINTKGLHLLPHVEVIDFSINHLTVVKTTAFKNAPSNLSTIVLSRNSLQSLEAGCFRNVTNLRILDLSHNLLKNVLRASFSAPARFLETINLSENFLENLPPDFFSNMPALRNVHLGRNFLHNMPEKPWVTVWRQLMYVDVTGNFLYCNCHLLWLLPILSPSKANVTNTPAPTPLPGQTIRGSCTFHRMPNYTPILHPLITLTRGMLMC